ncbi:MAG: hypothetical protein WC549_05900 [Actinomycetota bacterium]
MKNKVYTSTLVIFWIIATAFIPIIVVISLQSLQGQAFNESLWNFIALPLIFIIFILGIILIVLAAKAHIKRISKALFILAGSSAVIMALSAIQPVPGEGYYQGRIGAAAEWLFFILAQYLCPVLLLASAIGIIVLIGKKRI